MAGAYSAYIICGTPRSGSTLLCRMLAATGAAGAPGSFFREPDIGRWADRWGVPHPDGVETPAFDRAYLGAMLKGGRGGTGVFGMRIMWSSVATAAGRFDRAHGNRADITERFEAAFGRPLYIHLSRADKVAQAVSLLRAEQSGLWHRRADGSVLEGEDEQRPLIYDEERLAALVAERVQDDDAWGRFFSDRGIQPLRLTYEALSDNPLSSLARVLGEIGLDQGAATGVEVPTARLADATNAEWIKRFRNGPAYRASI